MLVFFGSSLGCGKASSGKGEPARALGKDAGALVRNDADGRGDDSEEEDEGGGEDASGKGASGASEARRGVRKLSLDADEIGAIFEKIPRLRELTDELRLFSEPYDVNVVKRRGSQDVGDWLFSANPVLWTPAGGEPHLIVTGKSKKDGFVVALERLPSGDYQLASSIIFRNDPGPFVLAYQANARERLQWTSCWKCKGDGGAIVAKDSGKRVVVIQQ